MTWPVTPLPPWIYFPLENSIWRSAKPKRMWRDIWLAEIISNVKRPYAHISLLIAACVMEPCTGQKSLETSNAWMRSVEVTSKYSTIAECNVKRYMFFQHTWSTISLSDGKWTRGSSGQPGAKDEKEDSPGWLSMTTARECIYTKKLTRAHQNYGSTIHTHNTLMTKCFALGNETSQNPTFPIESPCTAWLRWVSKLSDAFLEKRDSSLKSGCRNCQMLSWRRGT